VDGGCERLIGQQLLIGWKWMDKWRLPEQDNQMEMDERMAGALNLATLLITPEILSLIAEIDEFKGAWRAIGRIAPERLSGLRRVATIESIGSSTRIEGAKLSNHEVKKLLSNLELRSFTTRDEEEVAGYAEVMETIFAHWDAIPLTENHIKQLHRDLLAHSSKDERHRGAYKTLANHVEAFDEDGHSLGVVFATATPFDTPRLMAELVSWRQAQEDAKSLHPLLIIAVFIVVFLEIHPFQDGNGRLSRVLTTLLLLRAGYAYVPYSSLESVIEQSKEGYYLALRRTQGTIRTLQPDWNPWLDFFLRALSQQKRRLEKKVERERLILGALPELSVQILEVAREHGRVTVADAVKVTGASRNTIKDHVVALAGQGVLIRHGAGRGVWYTLA
jgi:Fic family protein